MILWMLISFLVKVYGAEEDVCTHTVQGQYEHHSRCTAQHVSGALMLGEGCQARLTLVAIPWPNISHIDQMTPTHVSIKQCDGPCTQYGHACSPTKTRKRSIPVLLSRCGISSGTCDKDCSSVEVEEHEECSCSCSLDPGDCPVNQTYRPDLCRCECKDILGREACLDSGQFWDDSTCTCGCTQVKECTPGMKFHQQTCSCVPIGSNLVKEEERIPRSTDDIFSFEIIVILILLSIILVLLVIVFTLLIRIQTMKKNFRLERAKLLQNNSRDPSDGAAEFHTQVRKVSFKEYYGEAEVARGEAEVARTEAEEAEEEKDEGGFTDTDCSTPSSGFYSESGHDRQEQLEQLYPRQQEQLEQLYPMQLLRNPQKQYTKVTDTILHCTQEREISPLLLPTSYCQPPQRFPTFSRTANYATLNRSLNSSQSSAAQ